MSAFLIGTLFAILCGGLIGLERELTGHKGSIKVNILICIGSFIFCTTELLSGSDDLRVAANVVTGVGFLCSGFIFKDGFKVEGLSTAATLWCSAGLGVLIANAHIIECLILSAFIIVANLIFSGISHSIKPLKAFDDSKKDLTYKYNIVCMNEAVEEIKKSIINATLEHDDLTLNSFAVNKITEDKKRIIIEINSLTFNILRIDGLLNGISSLDGVLSTSWEQKDN